MISTREELFFVKRSFYGLPVDVCVGLFLSDNAGYAVEGIEHLGAWAAFWIKKLFGGLLLVARS